MTTAADAEAAFLTALDELAAGYREQPFWVERDVVAWLQRRLTLSVPAGMTVWNDYGILPGPRRALSADLALVTDGPLLVAEFKFEPCARRADIMPNKLPVIGWIDVGKDIGRVQEFVEAGRAEIGWAICIDEGGRYAARPRLGHSLVRHWDTGYGTEVTMTRWPPAPPLGKSR